MSRADYIRTIKDSTIRWQVDGFAFGNPRPLFVGCIMKFTLPDGLSSQNRLVWQATLKVGGFWKSNRTSEIWRGWAATKAEAMKMLLEQVGKQE